VLRSKLLESMGQLTGGGGNKWECILGEVWCKYLFSYCSETSFKSRCK